MQENQLQDDMSYISKEEYLISLTSGDLSIDEVKRRHDKALSAAMDIRKFEIELYWKRAAYFWTLIAASSAGMAAIVSSSSFSNNRLLQYYSIGLACILLVFTIGWYLTNLGSKFWQKNWEAHVDALEDNIQGPLYKTVYRGNGYVSRRSSKILEDSRGEEPELPHSVSEVNKIVSVHVLGVAMLFVFGTLAYILRDFVPYKNVMFYSGVVLIIIYTMYSICKLLYDSKSARIS